MRPIHGLMIAAVLALGIGAAAMDHVQAQGVVRMSPPADGQGGTATYEDIKIQAGTALPPKAGAMVIFGPTRQSQMPTASQGAQSGARRTRTK